VRAFGFYLAVVGTSEVK